MSTSGSWLPLFHVGGSNGTLPYLMIGGTPLGLRRGNFDAGQGLELLERERITGCYFAPTQLQQQRDPGRFSATNRASTQVTAAVAVR